MEIIRIIGTIITLLATIIVSYFAIVLNKKQKALSESQKTLSELQKALTESERLLIENKNELVIMRKHSIENASVDFRELVINLDKKVSAFERYYSEGLLFKGVGSNESAFFNTKGLDRSANKSLFDYRLGHFTSEKITICQRFLDSLLKNKDGIGESLFKEEYGCDKEMCNQSFDEIYLLVDSGSTVFPLFKLLCDYYWNMQFRETLSRIHIITNNIPGISYLLDYGRIGGFAKSEMMYQCNVVPGIAEGKYNATLGKKSVSYINSTVKAIRKRIKDESKKAIFISLVTGNYISTIDGVLWRGDGHGMVKNSLIHNSDYVFILSPLGKLFNYSKDKINSLMKGTKYALSLEKEYKKLSEVDKGFPDARYCLDDSDNNEYDQIYNSNNTHISCLIPDYLLKEKEKPNKPVYLITTSRPAKSKDDYPGNLINYFARIHHSLIEKFKNPNEPNYQISDGNINKIQNIIFSEFNPLLQSEQVILESKLYGKYEAFLNYEFPHPELRDSMKELL